MHFASQYISFISRDFKGQYLSVPLTTSNSLSLSWRPTNSVWGKGRRFVPKGEFTSCIVDESTKVNSTDEPDSVYNCLSVQKRIHTKSFPTNCTIHRFATPTCTAMYRSHLQWAAVREDIRNFPFVNYVLNTSGIIVQLIES